MCKSIYLNHQPTKSLANGHYFAWLLQKHWSPHWGESGWASAVVDQWPTSLLVSSAGPTKWWTFKAFLWNPKNFQTNLQLVASFWWIEKFPHANDFEDKVHLHLNHWGLSLMFRADISAKTASTSHLFAVTNAMWFWWRNMINHWIVEGVPEFSDKPRYHIVNPNVSHDVPMESLVKYPMFVG